MGAVELEEVICMPPKQIKRFYEPMVLFKSLTMEMRGTATHIDLEESVPPDKPRELFEAAVNKVCYVCDNKKGSSKDMMGGRTITSFVVLQEKRNSPVHYVFASNQRSKDELEDTQDFVEKLLGLIGQPGKRKAVYRHVLKNNRKRIQLYLGELVKQIRECDARLEHDFELEDSLIAEFLKDIMKTLTDVEGISEVDESDFLDICEKVLGVLKTLEKSPASERIIQLAKEIRKAGQKSSRDCWPEMLHMIRRILAYRYSISFFYKTKDIFPELFKDFKISFVPSSEPLRNTDIKRNKSFKADGIVNRMTRKPSDNETFKAFVEKLQMFDLDKRIRSEYEKDSFRPVVHSEIHLHKWLEITEGGLSESRFFGGWKYIGSSKPTCRLCHYYFEEHNSGVRHRISHLNLYTSWRLPDVPASAGLEGVNKRQVMYDRIIQRIRKDTFDIIGQKANPTFRKHDSNTFSARMTLVDDFSNAVSDVGDVSSLFGNLNIGE